MARDGHTAAGDGKFAELADFYREAFAQEWATISFPVPDSPSMRTVALVGAICSILAATFSI